jgi:hypothetical protein
MVYNVPMIFMILYLIMLFMLFYNIFIAVFISYARDSEISLSVVVHL